MDATLARNANRILSHLPAAEFAELQPYLTEMTLHRGTVLHHAGERIEFVYFPTSGMVSLLTAMKTGEQIEAGIVGRFGVVGGMIGSFGPCAFGQAVVQIDGVGYQLARDRFLALYERPTVFRDSVNAYCGYLYFQAQQTSACHALHTVEARFARWMLQSQDMVLSDVLALTQEFLSQMMGVQRNAVSICAQSLQERKLIEYSRGTIRVLDRDGLKKVACECYEATRDYAARIIEDMPSAR